MECPGFSLVKNLNLKLKSIFNNVFDIKFEKSVDKSTSSVTVTGQNNIIFTNIPFAKESIKKQPKSIQSNVVNIIKQTQKNIETEELDRKITSPEPEWFGPFLDNCKNVSSKDLQKLWSKILQGKVNGKNNTSIRTMSILSKMNSSEAYLFNRFLKYMIKSDNSNLTLSNFMYHEERKMPGGFPIISQISAFREIGLITQEVNKHIIEPRAHFKNLKVGILGSYYDYTLLVHFKPNQTYLVIPVLFLSQAGVELSKFVSHKSDKAYLSCLSKYLKTQGYQLKALSSHKQYTTGLRPLIGEEVMDID